MNCVTPVGNLFCGQKIPRPRSGHRCVANDSNLYSFGGYNPHIQLDDDDMKDDPNWLESKPLFRELWKFNFATRCWIKLKTAGFVPKELASHSALLCDNYLMVYGGTGVPFGQSSSNKLHICDLRTLHWREVGTAGEPPLEQYGQAVTLAGNWLYVVGGTTGYEYSIDVHRLDMDSSRWEELVSKGKRPRERYRHEIAHYANSLFVFGGGTVAESFHFRKLPCFDLRTHTWHRVPTQCDPDVRDRNSPRGFPAPRRCHSLVHLDDDVFIYGGYNGEEIFTDVWKLNLNSMQWKRIILRVPMPTYFHSAALTPSGCMYVYGGVNHIRENVRTAHICKMWLKIPQLKEICWEAILFYWPKMPYTHSRFALLEAGVPSSFLDRIELQAECG